MSHREVAWWTGLFESEAEYETFLAETRAARGVRPAARVRPTSDEVREAQLEVEQLRRIRQRRARVPR
jgi:hypothetical protein